MKRKHKAMERLLREYRGNKNEVRDIEIQIERISNGYTGVGAISYDEKVDTGCNISSPVEREYEAKEKQIERLEERKRQINTNTARVENALGFLNEIQGKVIEGRYVKGLPWFKVAYSVGYSEGHTKRIKRQSIERMVERMYL